MIYKFMTTEDNAEIVHSELKEDGTVMVYVEKPDIKGLLSSHEMLTPLLFNKRSIRLFWGRDPKVYGCNKSKLSSHYWVFKSMNDWIKRNTILIDKRGQATSKAHLII